MFSSRLTERYNCTCSFFLRIVRINLTYSSVQCLSFVNAIMAPMKGVDFLSD